MTRKDKVIAALKDIYTKHGILRPADVVEAALNPKSPLHGCFEWDDDKAAKQYRLEQARKLIREVRVEYADQLSAPVFVHVETAGGYLPVQAVVENESHLQSAIRELKRQIRGVNETITSLVSLVETGETRKRIRTIASHVAEAEKEADAIA